jgi:cytoskeletal protein RodZ
LGAFGDKLRHQRERRGLSLDAISSTTKISTRMLCAIEEEHFEQLPGGVFNKGFVRAYARHVGLDEEETVGEYLDALRETQVQSQAILPNFRAPAMRPAPANESISHNGSTIPKTVDDLAIEDRIDYGRTAERRIRKDRRRAARRGHDRPEDDRPDRDRIEEDRTEEDDQDRIMLERSEDRPPETLVASAENIQVDEASEPEFDPAPSSPPSFLNLSDAAPSRPVRPYYSAAELAANDSGSSVRWEKLAIPLLLLTLVLAFWGFHRRNQNAAASQPAVSLQPAPVTPATSTTTAAAKLAAAAPVKPGAAAQSTAETDTDANPPARLAHAQPAKPIPPATFTLVIRAAQTSWIAITADGEPVARETLIAPAHTSVRASREITVKTGNAAGISFSLCHLDIPAQGNAGEVRSYTFDANGLRDSGAAQAAPSTR